jgi:sulfate adenylyltransferase subunit 1 (EFTu-like GTPase family)
MNVHTLARPWSAGELVAPAERASPCLAGVGYDEFPVRAPTLRDRVEQLWIAAIQQHVSTASSPAMNHIAEVMRILGSPVFPERSAENRATGSFILIDEAAPPRIAARTLR